MPRFPLLASLLSASIALALLTGCGAGVTLAPSSALEGSAPALSGSVFGGQQPVNGASIYLYAVGNTGNGMGATNLLTTAVTTNKYGGFHITGDYTCPANTQVYLVARGGNPGLTAGTNNAALALMTPLGLCTNLTPATFVQINEITTVAAVWALAPFMSNGAIVGASASNTLGLANAFQTSFSLVSFGAGQGPGTLPAGATINTPKLNTLADVLAGCINSDGTVQCTPLFRAATINGVVPTNTVDAALAIVRNPANNVTAVYNAGPPQPPFQPTLNQAPPDWTFTISYTGGGLNGPTVPAIDASGNVFVANYYGSVSAFSNTGQPLPNSPYTDPSLREIYGLTLDPTGNIWVTNQESDGSVNYGYGSLTEFSPSGTALSGNGFSGAGLYYPVAAASDTAGNIWVADNGSGTASYFNNGGQPIAPAAGYASGVIAFTSSVAVDGGANGTQNAWFGAQQAVVKVSPNGDYTSYACCSFPAGIAIDQAGFIWIADYTGSALVRLNSSGTTLNTNSNGGVSYPIGIALDASGTAWLGNYAGASISAFSGSSTSTPATALSPATGFGTDTAILKARELAVDSSGNIWLASFGNNALVEFVGLATPTKTPLLGPPVAP